MSGERIELDGKVAHKGGQQFVNGRGLFNSGYSRIHRLEPAGFASYPIKGANALLFAPNGDADQAYVVGGEHPEHRPDIPSGATAIYDHNGNIIKLLMSEVVFDFSSRTATFNAGHWTINCPSSFNGSMAIVGDLAVQGNITATGSITPHV
jgi:phage gp45-like